MYEKKILIGTDTISGISSQILEAIIKAFNKQSVTGIIFLLSFPSNRKKVKKIRFKIETGFPP